MMSTSGADRVAQRPDQLRRSLACPARPSAGPRRKNHFVAPEALRRPPRAPARRRAPARASSRACWRRPGIVVADRAAEQPVDRLPEPLALEVPERAVDGADRHHRVALAPVDLACRYIRSQRRSGRPGPPHQQGAEVVQEVGDLSAATGPAGPSPPRRSRSRGSGRRSGSRPAFEGASAAPRSVDRGRGRSGRLSRSSQNGLGVLHLPFQPENADCSDLHGDCSGPTPPAAGRRWRRRRGGGRSSSAPRGARCGW